MRLPLAAQSYVSSSRPLSSQSIINLFPEKVPDDSRVSFYLRGTPGLKDYATLGKGPIRGLEVMQGVLYAVSGDELYLVTGRDNVTKLGDVPGNGRAYLKGNGHQLMVVSGGKGYVYDVSTDPPTFNEVTDPDLPNIHSLAWMDGYHIVGYGDLSGQWGLSDLYDATSYDALLYATAEAYPDRLETVHVVNRILWLLGRTSSEVWYNSGAADFPFERINGAESDIGCQAPDSVDSMLGSLYFLGSDGIIYQTNGYTPTRISTHAIEEAIETYSKPDEAQGFTYKQAGHAFYCISFDEGTWCYDVTTGLWHERKSWQMNRWRVNSYVRAYGAHLVGDFQKGKIYELDLRTFTESGETIIRQAVSPPWQSQSDTPIEYARLELDVETGVGLPQGQGSDPKVMLDWSDNGGRVFGTELQGTLGAIGSYRHRVTWNALGSSLDRVYRVRISDPVPVSIYAAKVNDDG